MQHTEEQFSLQFYLICTFHICLSSNSGCSLNICEKLHGWNCLSSIYIWGTALTELLNIASKELSGNCTPWHNYFFWNTVWTNIHSFWLWNIPKFTNFNLYFLLLCNFFLFWNIISRKAFVLWAYATFCWIGHI